jgi:hypothetical protein
MQAALVSLFWLTALIPGFAVIQLFFPRDTRHGLLPTLAWSYVLTVALMVPAVAIAFALHLSVQVVAVYYAFLVLGGLVAALRYGGPESLKHLFRSAHWFELGLVLVMIALTVPLGASAQSDSFAHSAKIRFMRDVAFSLQDAYSPLPVIETKWHVNVHHALFAIWSWIGRVEPLDLWFRSAWFFRLLALGGIGFLAGTVFRSRWIATVAMIGAVPVMGTKLTIVFPFSVTGFAVSALLLAVVVDVLERPSAERYWRTAICSLSLAALHFGTWFLAAACIAPTVAVWTLWRHGAGALVRRAMLVIPILATGVPFLLISALQPNYVVAQQDELHLRMIRTVDLGSWKITVIDPTHYAWMMPVLAVMGLLVLVGRQHRGRLMITAGILAGAMACMFTPGIFDALVRLVPYWLVQRFRNFGEVIGLAIVTGGLAWLIRPRLRTNLARAAFALLVLGGGLTAFRENIQGYVSESGRQRRWLHEAARLQDAVRDVITPHSLVAADPEWSLVLPSVHLARVMAADLHHANPSDGGVLERHADTQLLLKSDTPDSRRLEIIAKHGIDFIMVRDKPGAGAPVTFDGVGTMVADRHGFRIYRIRQ